MQIIPRQLVPLTHYYPQVHRHTCSVFIHYHCMLRKLQHTGRTRSQPPLICISAADEMRRPDVKRIWAQIRHSTSARAEIIFIFHFPSQNPIWWRVLINPASHQHQRAPAAACAQLCFQFCFLLSNLAPLLSCAGARFCVRLSFTQSAVGAEDFQIYLEHKLAMVNGCRAYFLGTLVRPA